MTGVLILLSGQVRPRQGTETGLFVFFSSIHVQFSKTSPLKSGESSKKSSGENRVKSCHVCGCYGFFFGPGTIVSDIAKGGLKGRHYKGRHCKGGH